MKVLFVNDTSGWHAGSKAAVDSLCSRILGAGHVILDKLVPIVDPGLARIRDADMIVVNGEGSLRFETQGWDIAKHEWIRRIMRQGLARDKIVCLVNTVWHAQSNAWKEVILNAHSVSVRELASAQEMERQFGRQPEIHPDESWYKPVAETPPITIFLNQNVMGEVYKANMADDYDHNHPSFDSWPKLKLTGHDWEFIVKTLRWAKHYVTGQHHGVYAALKAGCPFVPLRTNTHKVPGLFRWAEVKIQVYDSVLEAAQAQPQQAEFLALQDFLNRQKPWVVPR